MNMRINGNIIPVSITNSGSFPGLKPEYDRADKINHFCFRYAINKLNSEANPPSLNQLKAFHINQPTKSSRASTITKSVDSHSIKTVNPWTSVISGYSSSGIIEMSATAMAPFSSVMANVTSPVVPEHQLFNLLDEMGNSTNTGILKDNLPTFEKLYSAINLSGLISFMDPTPRNLQAFTLLDGISAFVRPINCPFPHVAQHSEHIPDEGVNEMIHYFNTTTTPAPTSDPTKAASHDRAKKMIISRTEFLREIVNLLHVQSDFNRANMTPQLLDFLHGFSTMRSDFALVFHQGFETTPEALALVGQVRQPQHIAVYLREYNQQVAPLIAQADYQNLGRLAFNVNVLNYVTGDFVPSAHGTDLISAFMYMARDFLSEIEQITVTLGSFPLSAVLMFGLAWNPLQLLMESIDEDDGVCVGDVTALTIASHAGTPIPKAIKNMVNSVFWGVGYAELPFLVRMIIQEISSKCWLEANDPTRLLRLYLKVKPNSHYVSKFEQILDSMQTEVNDGETIESIEDLLEEMVAAFDLQAKTLPDDADVSAQLQIGLQQDAAAQAQHVIFAELKRVALSLGLTVCDTQQGLVWASGQSMSELVDKARDMLRPFAEYYEIPMETPPLPHVAPIGTVYQPPDAVMTTLESWQVIPDSALTLKEIMTHDIADLQTLDHIAIKALAKQYFSEVTSPEGLEKLKLPQTHRLEDLQVPQSDTEVTTFDPLVMQMREVLSVLGDAVENNTLVPVAIRKINAHIMLQTTLSLRAQGQSSQSATEADVQYTTMDILNALCPAINGAILAAGIADAAAGTTSGGRVPVQQCLDARASVGLTGTALGTGEIALLRNMLSSLRAGGTAGGQSFSLTTRVPAKEVQEVIDEVLTDYIVENALYLNGCAENGTC